MKKKKCYHTNLKSNHMEIEISYKIKKNIKCAYK